MLVAVYCMNFVIFLCVTLKLFSLSFVPLLAPDPGDATIATEQLHNIFSEHRYYLKDAKKQL